MTSSPASAETVANPGDVGRLPSASTSTARDNPYDRPEIILTDQTNLLPTRKIVVVFLGLASCIIVATLDTTIVATALPTIAAAFDAGSVASWIPSATLLTTTAFQPLYGRFSEYASIL